MAKGVAAVQKIKKELKGTIPNKDLSRAKFLLYGQATAGKTMASLQFPRPYVIDTERGTEPYGNLVEKQGGAVLSSSDLKEIYEEIGLLGEGDHPYETLVIDSFTVLYNKIVEAASKRAQGSLVWMEAKKMWTSLIDHAMRPDMNLIVICHGKNEYAEGQLMKKVGETWDGPRGLIYAFDLAFHLEREANGKRVANVVKTRLGDKFKENDRFDWSYEEVAKRFGFKKEK